ncbi:MAG: 50S ribosomal protein L11 methyltransferase [Desulfonatronovibrionaceae bacterium]
MVNNLFVLDIQAPDRERNRLRASLSDIAPWGWLEEEKNGSFLWRVHFDSLNRLDQAANYLKKQFSGLNMGHRFEKSEHWQENWKKFFTPVHIRNAIMVVPTWLADTPFPGTTIVIEPKMAFGTGHHATTTLCLQEIDKGFCRGYLRPEDNFLDLGTGSGILGIACAKYGMSGLGLDIEGTAIDNARENIALNRCENEFSVLEGCLEAIPAEEKFNLILANILANPLMQMAGDIVSRLKSQKFCLVLSGVLKTQANRVVQAYQEAGLGSPEIVTQDKWAVLVWKGQTK